MKRLVVVGGMMAIVVLTAAVARRIEAQDGADTGSIKAIMQGLHKSKTAALPAAKKALNAQPTDWAGAKAAGDTLVRLSSAMVNFDPPQGDKAGYVKKAEAYIGSAKAFDEAAKKQDLDGARAAVGRLGNSCSACHNIHRPQ